MCMTRMIYLTDDFALTISLHTFILQSLHRYIILLVPSTLPSHARVEQNQVSTRLQCTLALLQQIIQRVQFVLVPLHQHLHTHVRMVRMLQFLVHLGSDVVHRLAKF